MAEQKKPNIHLFFLSFYKAAFIEVISSNTMQTHIVAEHFPFPPSHFQWL